MKRFASRRETTVRYGTPKGLTRRYPAQTRVSTDGKVAAVPKTHGADDQSAERFGKHGDNTRRNVLFLRLIPGHAVRHTADYDRLYRG